MLKYSPFCTLESHWSWLTVIDLLMSEPGLVDSGKVVTAKSLPCGWVPLGAGHIWELTVWLAHKWLSHLWGQAGLHCQQLSLLLICKLILYFKNSRKLKKVLIQHILRYSKRAHKDTLNFFNTLQFAYLTPSPSSTTHNLFNMSKTAIMQLEIRGGGMVKETRAKSNTSTNNGFQFVKSM